MIQCFLTGRIGKDADIRELEGGRKVMNYSVAVDTGTKDKPATLWVDCSQWSEKTAVAAYLLKGTQVAVYGQPSVRAYAKQDGTPGASFSLRVDRVELLGGNKLNPDLSAKAATSVPQPSDFAGPIDNLPF